MMKEKTRALKLLRDCFEEIDKLGIEIAIASDPEGNGFNTINSKVFAYDPEATKGNILAIAVWRTLMEDEVFKED